MKTKSDYRIYKVKKSYACNHCWFETRKLKKLKEYLYDDHAIEEYKYKGVLREGINL